MLYLIEILHQTTTARRRSASNAGCILSKFYIKPQQLTPYRQPGEVVSYRNSTSNHNLWTTKSASEIVVSYRNSTSNHNIQAQWSNADTLYLIEILHQTTTTSTLCVLIICCILSKFYIKPQLAMGSLFFCLVVSYRNSTSNHNRRWCQF